MSRPDSLSTTVRSPGPVQQLLYQQLLNRQQKEPMLADSHGGGGTEVGQADNGVGEEGIRSKGDRQEGGGAEELYGWRWTNLPQSWVCAQGR